MSNLVILAAYHFNRSGKRLLWEPKTLNEKSLLRDSISGGQYTCKIWSLNAVLDLCLNSSKVIQQFSTKTDKGYQGKKKLRCDAALMRKSNTKIWFQAMW